MFSGLAGGPDSVVAAAAAAVDGDGESPVDGGGAGDPAFTGPHPAIAAHIQTAMAASR
jgi:hypothetical protein